MYVQRVKNYAEETTEKNEFRGKFRGKVILSALNGDKGLAESADNQH
jgi:hypothetical protein